MFGLFAKHAQNSIVWPRDVTYDPSCLLGDQDDYKETTNCLNHLEIFLNNWGDWEDTDNHMETRLTQYFVHALTTPKVRLIWSHLCFFPCFGTKTMPFLECKIVHRHSVTLVYTSGVLQAKHIYKADSCFCLAVGSTDTPYIMEISTKLLTRSARCEQQYILTTRCGSIYLGMVILRVWYFEHALLQPNNCRHILPEKINPLLHLFVEPHSLYNMSQSTTKIVSFHDNVWKYAHLQCRHARSQIAT